MAAVLRQMYFEAHIFSWFVPGVIFLMLMTRARSAARNDPPPPPVPFDWRDACWFIVSVFYFCCVVCQVYEALLQYKAEHGSLNVPVAFRVPSSPPWHEALWGLALGQRWGIV